MMAEREPRTSPETRYDLVSMGRSNMDLFSQDIGEPFENITGFDAAVGGSPTNIAIGLARLGKRAAVLGAVGSDRVGDFVLRFLERENVETRYLPRKEGKLTSLSLTGVRPPSDFPLSFYREDPADIYVDSDDVAAVPFDRVRTVQISGTALSRGPCARAAREVAELCARLPVETYMDLDLRPSEWTEPRAFGEAVGDVLAHIDVVIGTEEEFYAALMPEPEKVWTGAAVPEADLPDLDAMIDGLVGRGPECAVIKRGERGATLLTADGRLDVGGFTVDVVNTVGAGDSFAAGLIASRIDGLDFRRAVRFANACGAIVVTRHGCSVAFPRAEEVREFANSRGGL